MDAVDNRCNMIDDRLPKYYLVKKSLVEKIENEEFQPGEPIPSERELMEDYQVSRITIRKAIEELVAEGYLYKVQGIKATVQRAEFDHLPNYIAVRYRLQKVSMDGQKVIFLYPKTELEQIEDLKAQLKSTGDAILAECAVKDHIWGIGLSMKDPDRLDVKKWHGTNLLGYALMIVRERV